MGPMGTRPCVPPLLTGRPSVYAPNRSWAPILERPVILNGNEREFVYVYGAGTPRESRFV
jgi:hypothetical protein